MHPTIQATTICVDRKCLRLSSSIITHFQWRHNYETFGNKRNNIWKFIYIVFLSLCLHAISWNIMSDSYNWYCMYNAYFFQKENRKESAWYRDESIVEEETNGSRNRHGCFVDLLLYWVTYDLSHIRTCFLVIIRWQRFSDCNTTQHNQCENYDRIASSRLHFFLCKL